MQLRTQMPSRGARNRTNATEDHERRSLAMMIARRATPLISGGSLLFAGAAHAAPINVDEASPGVGAVAVNNSDGLCSLVEAITAANSDSSTGGASECEAGSDADTIVLPANTVFSFTASHNATDGRNALPSITTPITIEGQGATIERDTAFATETFRLLHVAASGDLALDQLSLRGGVADAVGHGSFGGAILSFGTLSISNSTLSGNSAELGGGIMSFEGGTLSIHGSTLYGNTAGDLGGAVHSYPNQPGASTVITNSTISGNSASSRGGGINNENGLTVLRFNTITGNTASIASGVFSWGDDVTSTNITGSIISGNSGNSDVHHNKAINSFVSRGDNLVGGGNGATNFNVSGDQTGITDPQLHPLANNGGPTLTHLPMRGSPVIDAVIGTHAAITTDQRGVPRPVDGDNDGTATRDMGAVEAPTPIFVSGSTTGINGGDHACSLIEALENANNTTGAPPYTDCVAGSTIGRDVIVLAPSTVFTFTASYDATYGRNALPSITTPITIEGQGAIIERDSASATETFRLLHVAASGDLALDQLTLRGGVADADGNGLFGGAILSFGTLSISNSSLSGNRAALAGGGILSFQGGKLSIHGSTLFGNTAGDTGGAVFSFLNQPGASTVITNSTISGNSASYRGGGINNENGLTVLRFNTITGNTATNGSGVFSWGDDVTHTDITGSIISGNSGSSDVHHSNAGVNSFTSGGNNLIGGGNGATNFNVSGDQTGITDPQLHPLANNGGPTLTHLPMHDSPVIDAVIGTHAAITTDQRGVPRPVDGNNDGTATRDMGAVEAPTPIIVSGSTTGINDGDDACSLIEALENANDTAGNPPHTDCVAGSTIGRDVIVLQLNTVFTFTASHNTTEGRNALPAITTPITIEGQGAIIERDGASATTFRLLHVAASGDLALDQLLLQGGVADVSAYGTAGGAILSFGTLSISKSTLFSNAASDIGGGIGSFQGGTLSIHGSTLYGNTAGRAGGAVFSYLNQPGASTVITNSTISGNSASTRGGGIDNDGGLTVLRFNTITGNTASIASGVFSWGTTSPLPTSPAASFPVTAATQMFNTTKPSTLLSPAAITSSAVAMGQRTLM